MMRSEHLDFAQSIVRQLKELAHDRAALAAASEAGVRCDGYHSRYVKSPTKAATTKIAAVLVREIELHEADLRRKAAQIGLVV